MRASIQECNTKLDSVEATLHIVDILILAREYLIYDVGYSAVIEKALGKVRENFERCMIDPDASMDRIYAVFLSKPLPKSINTEIDNDAPKSTHNCG